MPAEKYVGRAANSDASMVNKAHVDTRHAAVAVTPDYVSAAVASHAASTFLVNQTYVDNADATRAKKTAVDAADANYLPTTARGAANGVASLDGSVMIPSAQLPTLQTDNLLAFVDAQTVYLTGEQSVSSTTTKTYQAAVLSISDPGYAYRPLIFASVGGRSPDTVDHSRRAGGASRGKMTILSASDALFGGGIGGNARGRTLYHTVPTAAQGVTPTSITGALTLTLWLALHSGTSYTFDGGTGFRFFALVLPAG